MIRWKDFAALVLLSLFSTFVTCYGFLKGNSLYWDTGLFFSLFRDNLHSLNKFGEFAWWFPHRQFGWPAYYYSILGQLAFASPLQVLLSSMSYLLGQFGVTIESYFPWFIFSIGFLSPLLVNTAVFLLARQLFSNRQVAYFAVILAAFSPSVVFNLSDPGFLEPAAYGIFFAVSFLALLQKPTRTRFFVFGLTCCLLAINLNFPFVFWNVIAIPTFLIAVIFLTRDGRKKLMEAWQSTARRDVTLVLFAISVCAVPSFLIFSQVGHLIRYRMGQKAYDFTALYVGNPLEMVSVGWPGFGFDLEGSTWKLLPPGPRHIGLTYLGLLCLPLTMLGLMRGSRRLRYGLGFMLLMGFGVYCLSAFSPIFATLLVWDTPLRTNNHFGDAFFRSGSYLLLIFTAALGFDTIARGDQKTRKLMLWIYLVITGISAVVIVSLFDQSITSEPNFGFFTVMAPITFLVLAWLANSQNTLSRSRLMMALMAVTLVDVSTVVNLHVRNIMTRPQIRVVDETPSSDGLGMVNADPADYSRTILMYREYYDLLGANIDPSNWPMFRVFNSAHASEGIMKDNASFEDQSMDSLAIDEKDLQQPPFRKFADSGVPSPRKVGIQGKLDHLTFNEVEVEFKAQRDSVLFFRDAYSPFWKATVNGVETPIARAMGNFKAIVLPEGPSTVRFRFQPPGVQLALWTAYLVIFLMGGICFWLRRVVPREMNKRKK